MGEILAIIFLISIFVNYCLTDTPAKEYERKLQEIDKAEKELQKFLIGHPEFKESEL